MRLGRVCRILMIVLPVFSWRQAVADEPCQDRDRTELARLEKQLATERAALAGAKQQLTSDIAAFNSSCGQSPSDSCRSQRQGLATRQSDLNGRIDRWQKDKERYEKLKADLDARLPSVNPGALVTKQAYESAKIELARLRKFQSGLERELDRIKGSNGALGKDRAEFANIRAEAFHGIFSDVLSGVQAGWIAKQMAKDARYARYITPEGAEKFNAAYEALRSAVAGVDLASARPGAQQLRSTLDTVTHAREAMLGMAMARIPEDDLGRRWLEGTGHTITAFGAVVAFELEQEESAKRGEAPKDEAFLMSKLRAVGPPARLVIEVAAAYAPPVEMGRALEGVGERVATWYFTREPIKALENALSENWKATNHLSTKLAEVKARMIEQDRLIGAYEKCHNAGAP